MPAARDEIDDLGDRRVGPDRRHLGSRHHHFRRGELGEMEHAMEHLLFVFLEHAGLLARRHEHLELFFRMNQSMTAGGLQPEHPDDRPAHGVQRADERIEKRGETAPSAWQQSATSFPDTEARLSSAPARQARYEER